MSVYRIRLWKSFFSFFFFLSAINTNQNEKKRKQKARAFNRSFLIIFHHGEAGNYMIKYFVLRSPHIQSPLYNYDLQVLE